ncbi:MAG: hypothetical protein ACOCV9_04970 [Marinilabiliaceae bacterium]
MLLIYIKSYADITIDSDISVFSGRELDREFPAEKTIQKILKNAFGEEPVGK